MQRNKSCDQNRGTGLKAVTNPDINVKLERGKCESVEFGSTVRDYQILHGNFFLWGGTCYAGDQHVGQDGCLRSQILGGILGRFYSSGKVKSISKKVLKVQGRYF